MGSEHDEYHVIIDPAANDRMFEHFDFLAQVNEQAANRLLDELLNDIESLETFPYINPVFNRPYLPQGKYRYKISSKRYRIVYQIENNLVFIDDIQDCRQDDDRSLLYNDDIPS